jgi:glycine/D-amino acid oxidase-like deaminating enzyme
MTGYLTANDTPGAHAASWYAATAGAIPDHPELTGETRADVCIVGAGYAGLSAALHLAGRGLDVALVEANRVGWGASGRNGGQLGIGPRAEIQDYERAVGRDDARKVWDIAIAANRLVKDLIARHGIDCSSPRRWPTRSMWRAITGTMTPARSTAPRWPKCWAPPATTAAFSTWRAGICTRCALHWGWAGRRPRRGRGSSNDHPSPGSAPVG